MYSGLNVVLDRPSRFDTTELISGWAGEFFNQSLFNPQRKDIIISRHNLCIQILEQHKKLGSPQGTKTLLLLGESSLRFYKPESSLLSERGSPFILQNGVVAIASFSPQDSIDRQNYFDEESESESENEKGDEKTTGATTRRKNWQFWLRQDIRKACRIAKEGVKKLQNYQVILWPDIERVVGELRNTRGGKLVLDIETNSHLEMTCFGYNFVGSPDVVVVPMVQTYLQPNTYFYGNETFKILSAMAVAIRNNTTILHNGSFDLFILAYKYGIPFNINSGSVVDTMVSHHRLYTETEKSLGHCISLYTDLPYHKNTGVYEPHNHAQTQQLYTYNANDIIGTTEVWRNQQPEIERLQTGRSVTQACDSITPYLLATLQGLNINEEGFKTRVEFNERLKAQYKRMLKIMAGREINPGSWQQISKYLYDKTIGLGLKCPDSSAPTAEKTLQQLKLKHDLPTLGCILNYRGLTTETGKLKFERWGGARNEAEKRRVTGSYIITGTSSFRLSSRKLLSKWGTNMQNWEKGIRKYIIPDKGKVFVQVDQSGAEALIVSYLCSHGRFRELFINKIKPHTYFALHQFRKVWEDRLGYNLNEYLNSPIRSLSNLSNWKEISSIIKSSDEWDSKSRYYYYAKQGCHSGNYDIKPPTFRLNLLLKSHGAVVIDNRQASEILSGYHGLFPEIKNDFHRSVYLQVKNTRTLKNLFGFPRIFTSYLDDSQCKEWYAFIPQSTVGTITNIAFTKLQQQCYSKEFKDNGVDILQNNHDSILAQCNIGFENQLAKIIKDELEKDLVNPRGEKFKMGSETYVGENWKEMKEIKV